MRWFVLSLGMLANLIQGMAYAGSVISVPLLAVIGITDAVAVKQYWAGIFSLSCLLLPIGMLTAGKLAAKYSPRLPIALGAIFYSAGLLLSPYTTNYTMLCLTFGVLLSLGSGFAYGPILAAAVQRFPDKKGLAGGLSVSALGLGPVVIAPTCAYLLKNGFSITAVLQLFGVFALAAVGLAACFTGKAPNYKPKNEPDALASDTRANTPGSYSVPWNEMIRQRRFWLLFTLLFLGTVPGLMVISNANNIFLTLGGFGMEQAAWLVAVLGAANAAGRFLWGTVSDFAGRTNVLTLMFALSAAAMFALAFNGIFNGTSVPASYLLIAATFVLVTIYGGYLGLFPSFCAEAFGLKNMAVNYAVLFIAFSTASFIGPRIYALLEPQTAFCLAGALCCFGLVASRKSG
jgi:OFA family oxalate/formate antiporter-like MFS transporter